MAQRILCLILFTCILSINAISVPSREGKSSDDDEVENLEEIQSDYQLDRGCGKGEIFSDCSDPCEATCSYNPKKDRRPKSCGKNKCEYGCFCKPGYVRHNSHCIRKDNCPKPEKCSEDREVFCRSPKKKDCIKTCQNSEFELEFWMKCDPEKNSHCIRHCDCPKGEIWDDVLKKCTSECVPTCPKSRRIYCNSTNIVDCVKTCDNQLLKISEEYRCGPKDPNCKVYCDCGPGRYLDPLLQVCVKCGEAETCIANGGQLTWCNKPNSKDCTVSCLQPKLSPKLECGSTTTPGLCHQHCKCSGTQVEYEGSCIELSQCKDILQCKVKINCLATVPADCDNTCGVTGKTPSEMVTLTDEQCAAAGESCVKIFVCPEGTLEHATLGVCVYRDECGVENPDICAGKDQRPVLVGCMGKKKDCDRTCDSNLDKTKCCIISETNTKCRPTCVCDDYKIWDEATKTCVDDPKQCTKTLFYKKKD